MPRLSKLLEKLEDTVEARWGVWFQRHKKKLPLYIPVGLVCWYFYGMLLNSMRLGIDAVFHNTGQDVTAIWIFDPIRNWLAIFSGFGLKATAFFVLMFCLVTKRGYLWFSGYKYTRDPRGFDILPDGTHGSSGFLTKREMEAFLEIGPILAELGGFFRCAEINVNDIFDLSFVLLTEYICVDMPDDDSDDPYGDEFTRFILSEPELDEYLDLIAKLEEVRFNTARCTGWNKLRDAVEMFAGNVLFDFKIARCDSGGGCEIYLWPPPEWYAPIELANSIIDLMTYINAEIDRMKAELATLTAAEQEMEVAA